MKKYITALAAFIIMICSTLPVFAAEASVPVIESEAAILMDARTGQILFEKNMHEQLAPASITKIMTVLLGIENGDPDDIVTMSREAVYSITFGSSHIALDTGEQITLEQALMAAMLPSANDASNGIAEHISGSIPEFVQLMNERAVQAGALHTNFTNTNGLNDQDHVSTAYDMAMITRSALTNSEFRTYFGTAKYEIPPTNMQEETRYLWAGHRMFESCQHEYDGFIGGKTGYTTEAKNTLVTAAKRGPRELIAVIIKNDNGRIYQETKELLDYGFDQFREVAIDLPNVPEEVKNQPDHLLPATKMLSNMESVSYVRLLHNDFTVDDILIDYTTITGDADVQIIADISVKDPGDLMYKNIASIMLDNPPDPLAEDVKETALPDILLKVLFFVLKLLAVFIILLFILRWLNKTKRIKIKRPGKR